MSRYDVFLSHANADKPAVEHLARKLQEAGLEPFLDIWCLVGGKLREPALEQVLRKVRRETSGRGSVGDPEHVLR